MRTKGKTQTVSDFFLKAMYGLRDAPLIWQKVVKEMLEKRGFVALVTSQCVYVNKSTGVIVVAHVDDFLCSGPRAELVLLRKQLKESYDVDGDILGVDSGEVPEGKFAGRLIRFTKNVIEWEADRKQVKGLLKEYGLG